MPVSSLLVTSTFRGYICRDNIVGRRAAGPPCRNAAISTSPRQRNWLLVDGDCTDVVAAAGTGTLMVHCGRRDGCHLNTRATHPIISLLRSSLHRWAFYVSCQSHTSIESSSFIGDMHIKRSRHSRDVDPEIFVCPFHAWVLDDMLSKRLNVSS